MDKSKNSFKIKWSPIESEDIFVKYKNNNISLYNTSYDKNSDQNLYTKLDEFTNIADLSCLAWGKSTFCGYGILTFGTSKGAIKLCFFDELYRQESSHNNENIKSFFLNEAINISEDIGKACNSISANPIDSSKIVAGFDLSQNSPRIKVIDLFSNILVKEIVGGNDWVSDRIEKIINYESKQNFTFDTKNDRKASKKLTLANDLSFRLLYSQKKQTDYFQKFDFNASASVKSVEWLPRHPLCFIAGSTSENSCINIYDTSQEKNNASIVFYERESHNNTSNDAIYDIEFDPFNPYRFLANDRHSVIKMYDLRMPFGAITINVADKLGSNIKEAHYNKNDKNSISVLGSKSSEILYFAVDSSPKSSDNTTTNLPTNLSSANSELKDSTRVRLEPKYKTINTDSTSIIFSSKIRLQIDPNVTISSFSISDMKKNVSDTPNQNIKIPCEFSNNTLDRNQYRNVLACLSDGTFVDGSLPKNFPAAFSPTSNISVLSRNEICTLKFTNDSVKTPLLGNNKSGVIYDIKNFSEVSVNNEPLKNITKNLAIENLSIKDIQKTETNIFGAGYSKINDISISMHERAVKGYSTNPETNLQLFPINSEHWNIWRWIRDVLDISEHGLFNVGENRNLSLSGVFEIISISKSDAKKLKEQVTRNKPHLLDRLYGVHNHNRPKDDYINFKASNAFSIPSFHKKIYEATSFENNLNVKKNNPNYSMTSNTKTRKNIQRLSCLLTCGFDLSTIQLMNYLESLVANKKHIDAVSTCILYGHHDLVVDILMHSEDPRHKLFSFLLSSQLDSETKQFTSFDEKLRGIPNETFGEIFDDPIILVTMKFLSSGSWMEALKHSQSLKMAEKLALALNYLDDQNGLLEGLMLTGIQNHGYLLLSNYVSRTSDVQTAALISSINPPISTANNTFNLFLPSNIAECFNYEYRSLLNKWKLFSERCLFDISVGEFRVKNGLERQSSLMKDASGKSVNVRCTFCRKGVGYMSTKSKSIGPSNSQTLNSVPEQPGSDILKPKRKTSAISSNRLSKMGSNSNYKIQNRISGSLSSGTSGIIYGFTRSNYTHCPKCLNKLPNCSICRLALGTPENANLTFSDYNIGDEDNIDSWFLWCQTCGHGGHSGHMKTWFFESSMCPSPGCGCNCIMN
ncbi:hypothetical protein BB559_004699 [Furculomyces boomerangus]|uniref:GATOR2 complex protein MIO zinc-ribbon like domain-containing protein n=1 Tax=Furculomyces boomerangus TaxID=61424 RepID=A0A2T9YD81_9FUNG|nr:hypothetical protein BB559_004699 [Furculomyces boomerangus]